jgi:oligopeptide transport system substrate-binding protein
MLRKSISLVLVVLLIMSVITACGDTGSEENDTNVLNLTVGPEPETIDPTLNTSSDGGTYITHFFEGLTKTDNEGNAVSGVAEKWDISEDGTKYTFYLRSDAKWSDGENVTAQDFEYGWKRILNPETASDYASMLFPLVNGEEYNAGEADAEDVGVKAVDDTTLEVTLKAPTVYFLTMLFHSTYMPIREDIIKEYGDKWTQSPDSYVSNGAYKMKEWKHNDVIAMEKNENYWDADNIKIEEVNWKLLEDDVAALNAYDSGELNGLFEQIPVTEMKPLLDEGKAEVAPMLGTYYIEFCVDKDPVNDAKVRKALSLAIDRQLLIDTVTQAGEKPATGMVPYGTSGAEEGTEYRDEEEAEEYIEATANIDEAKKLLEEAGYPDGEGFPSIELIYNTDTGHEKNMEFIQEQWKKNLNIDVKISNMEWKSIIPKRQEHDFTIARAGWVADYNDPMTFLELFTIGNGNNDSNYNSEEYTDLIKKVQLEADANERMKLMHEAESILMEDMPIIPIYFYVSKYMVNDNLEGLYVSNLGIYHLDFATFE